ncbi:hypothetical protein HS088_TW01G00320 [Tripterygium wilfordii]|uniref:Uncharacterized protein n=1 Tax=Tripterygium wilfordii TaxID=458696 RepID=A0A7J7E1K6_TRIWF|nr:hypothetical protein HS088_TW01G00320 [Tripterygium wilfordii]
MIRTLTVRHMHGQKSCKILEVLSNASVSTSFKVNDNALCTLWTTSQRKYSCIQLSYFINRLQKALTQETLVQILRFTMPSNIRHTEMYWNTKKLMEIGHTQIDLLQYIVDIFHKMTNEIDIHDAEPFYV